MARRPTIGITTRLEHETRRFYIGRDYCEAIFAAGGTPVLVPLIPDPAYIEEIVSRLDGIFLPGCDSDPDPALYGEDPHPKLNVSTKVVVLAGMGTMQPPIFASPMAPGVPRQTSHPKAPAGSAGRVTVTV